MIIVEPSEFCGAWLMDHDGQTGKLVLEGTADPETLEITALSGRFTGDDGHQYEVDSIRLDVHKISFIVHFTEHDQLFRGYLFTDSRDAMAGYTIRDEERFGWFAILAESALMAT